MSVLERVEEMGRLRRVPLALALCLITEAIAAIGFGLPTAILLLGFWLLLLALSLLWSSINALDEDEPMSLDEALLYAEKARDEERKVSLLRSLKDLEYEHGLGKISDDDFLTLSQRYRREAKVLLERLDTQDSAYRQRIIDAVQMRMERKL
jgi:hypothetical protein